MFSIFVILSATKSNPVGHRRSSLLDTDNLLNLNDTQ